MSEGGIMKPNVPDPAKLPRLIARSYPRLSNSGRDIFPIVATVAAEDPEGEKDVFSVKNAVLTALTQPLTGSVFLNMRWLPWSGPDLILSPRIAPEGNMIAGAFKFDSKRHIHGNALNFSNPYCQN